MKILQLHNHSGWITAIISGRWCQAQVYGLPSIHGINGGRVSKLAVGKSDRYITGQNFCNQMSYNYDRCLYFDNLPSGVLDDILKQLEARLGSDGFR
jgi:hypothetical protein